MNRPSYSDSEQDSEAIDDEQALDQMVNQPLKLKDRPPMTLSQKIFGCLFYGQLVLQAVATVAMIASGNVQLEAAEGGCPTGWRPLDEGSSQQCVTEALYQKRQQCLQQETARRLVDHTLGGAGLANTRNMWEMLADNAPIPAGAVFLTFGLCAVWFLALNKYAGYVTWGTFACNIALMLYGLYLTHNWMLVVSAVAVALIAIVGRKEMEVAIHAMKLAADALRASPLVFVVCAAVHLMWAVYGLCLFSASIYVGRSKDINPETCHLSQMSPAATFYVTVVPFLFMVTTWFFKNCVLATCSLTVGCWYFRQEEPPSHPAILGVRYAATTSSGSIFGASLIMGVVEFIRKSAAGDCCWWADPVACLVRMLWCFLEGIIGALSRFALIGHMFRGEGLCWVASLTFDTLKRQLPGACMTGFVSEKVMSQISMVFATGTGFLVWKYLDVRENLGIFHAVASLSSDSDDAADDAGQWVMIGLTLLMLYCVRRPLPTIVLMFLFQADGSCTSDWVNSFSIAVLVAALASVIFQYCGCILEYSTDTVFYCFALEAESGKRQARMVKFYDVMQKATAGEEPQNLAQGQLMA
mmetsp:Transcript_88151/g.257678  ORF Transcript_88151/g.257678 Transcript_88151/m.257678 type:complete len:583 (+) Transcript_88151:112-1860(+)